MDDLGHGGTHILGNLQIKPMLNTNLQSPKEDQRGGEKTGPHNACRRLPRALHLHDTYDTEKKNVGILQYTLFNTLKWMDM